MSNPENGNFRESKMPELTAPRGRGYHGNMAEQSTAERWNIEPSSHGVERPKFGVIEGGAVNMDREAWRRLEMTGMGEGIRMYSMLRPEIGWDNKDYAGLMFMLGHDNSNRDVQLVRKTISRMAGNNPAAFTELANFETNYLDIYGKEHKMMPEVEDDVRGYLVNYSAWKDLDRRGLLKNRLNQLSIRKLAEYSMYWTGSVVNNDFYDKHQSDVRSILLTLGDVVKHKEATISSETAGNEGGGGGNDNVGGGAGGGGDEGSWRKQMLEATQAILGVNIDQLSSLNSISNTLEGIHLVIKEINKNLADFIDNEPKTAELKQKMIEEDLKKREWVTEAVKARALIIKKRLEFRKKIEEHEIKELEKRGEISDIELEKARFYKIRQEEQNEDENKLINKKPWEEKDKELFEGNVDSVLKERMMRVEYLCIMSEADSKGIDFDEALSSGHARSFFAQKGDENSERLKTEFLARMREHRIYETLKKNGSVERETGTYMQELKKWAKIIENNSQYNKGDLIITTETYNKIKQILAVKTKLYEYGGVADEGVRGEFRREMLKTLDVMRVMDFDKKYFTKKDSATGRLIGIKYKQEKEYAGEDTPRDLFDTCKLIEMLYPKENYKTGEEHELFNEYGEFQLHNFIHYTYERMWEYSDRNSQSQVNLLGDIGLRTRYTEVTYGQLMEIPKYTQVRNFKISGDESDPKHMGAGWGDYEDHPQLNGEVRDVLKRIVWQLQVRHNGGVAFLNPSIKGNTGKSVEAMWEFAGKADKIRNGYLLLTNQRPSSKEEEVEAYFKHFKQGSVGKAERDVNLVLRYMTELSQHYTNNDNGKIVGVRSIEENNALKTLGYDGASSLMLKIAESSLMLCEHRADLQKKFREYQVHVMRNMNTDYRDKITDPEKIKELDLLVNKKIEELMRPDIEKEVISFDSSKAINELLMAIETNILGKTIVRDNEYDKWKGTGRVISRKAVNEEARKKLRKDLKAHFLDKALDMEIVNKTDGEVIRQKIGQLEVKTCNGRIVTDGEWEKIDEGRASKGTMTIREIFNEFSDFGEIDGGRLKDDELDYTLKIDKFKADIAEAEKNGRNDEAERIRAELAAHKRTQKEKYQAIYDRNERLGLALMTKVAKLKRGELNWFNSPEPSRAVITISRDSIVASAAKVYGLSEIEKKVVGEGIHYDQVLSGNALINNTASPRYNALSWFMRTKQMWFSSRGVKPNSGLYGEVNAIMPGTWDDVLEVKNNYTGITSSYTKLFQGGEEMADREDREQNGNRRMYDTSREEFGYKFSRYIMDGLGLVENLQKDESLELHKLVTRDEKGVLRFDTEKAREEMKKHWHPIWDAYDKVGTNQNELVRIDGKTMRVREYLFGEKTNAAIEALKYYHKKHAREGGKDAKLHEEIAKDLEIKPAKGVLAGYFAASIKEHSDIFGGINEYWDPEVAKNMWWFLGEYFKKEGEDADGKKVETSCFPLGMMDDVLYTEGISESGQTVKKLFVDLMAALVGGVFDKGVQEILDEIVQIEKVYRGR